MNVTECLREQAQRKSDAIAVVRHGNVPVTYRDLDRSIDYAASRALALALRPGMTVALSSYLKGGGDPYAFLVLSLAFARIGVATGSRLLPAKHRDRSIAIGPVQSADELSAGPEWYTAPESGMHVEPVPVHQDPSAICRIFPSSGTTGLPKHIAITHEMMWRRIERRREGMPFSSSLCLMSAIGYANHYWFRDALNCLSLGGKLVLTPFLKTAPEHRINYLIAPPNMIERILQNRAPDAGPDPSLETVEIGGSLLSIELANEVRKRLCANIYCSYGSTEAGPVARGPFGSLEHEHGAVGFLDPGVEMQAVDENDRILPPGTTGRLRIRSDTCVTSYFDDPQASARSFRQGWFYPGDLGSVSPAGMLTIAGRVDEIINRGGNKISPLAIDAVLRGVPGIHDAAAFGMPRANGRTEIWAAIVVEDAPSLSETLQATCRAALGANAPTTYIRLKKIPRNEMGKIVRHDLVRIAQRARKDPSGS
jgi:acyl-CoA synthetase (AMP-forming)/AMP-acid ligase II